MSIETRTSRLVKKNGVEKSRRTVPLRGLRMPVFVRVQVHRYAKYARSLQISKAKEWT
jgi:hypothetical protein